jgi:hypothetical protein
MAFVEKNAFKILSIWAVILGSLYSALSILRHNHFQSGGFDLASTIRPSGFIPGSKFPITPSTTS